MKKKLVSGVFLFVLMFSLVGCGSKKVVTPTSTSDIGVEADSDTTGVTKLDGTEVSKEDVKPADIISPDAFDTIDFTTSLKDASTDSDFNAEEALSGVDCRAKELRDSVAFCVKNNNAYSVGFDVNVTLLTETGEELRSDRIAIDALDPDGVNVFVVGDLYRDGYEVGKSSFTVEINDIDDGYQASLDRMKAISFTTEKVKDDDSAVNITATNNNKDQVDIMDYSILFYQGDTLVDASSKVFFALKAGGSDSSKTDPPTAFDNWKICVNSAD